MTLSVFSKIPIALYNPQRITPTLQGCIYRASTSENESECGNTLVVKLTEKKQHDKSISMVNGTVYRDVQEDILSEQSILKYLSQETDCPQSIAKHIDFFKTDEYFVLVQEDGGNSLFNFVKNAHILIKDNKIDISHWKKVVKEIVKQMVECIAYIHSKNICHHDISLENFLINDVTIEVDKAKKITFIVQDIQIKLCDFGLAEKYPTSSCLSNKYYGKTQYKSPESVYLMKNYDAKKNDLWALGVCSFMLLFGSPPWHIAHQDDMLFVAVMSGQISELLNAWGLSKYVDPFLLNFLLQNIFKYEEKRIDSDGIKSILHYI